MATWTARPAVRGIAVSRWGRPPPPPYFSDIPSSETPPTTPPDPTYEYPDHPLDNGMPVPSSPMEEVEVQDWLESQLAATGEMSVVERLQYLLDTGQFADVSIRVGQGNNVTVFKAHRLLLATASQPLYKLVYNVNPSPGPNDVTTIRVTDMKASDFGHILKYIYTDTIDCSNINVAFELLRASKKWGLAGLGIKSLNFLEAFLDDYQPDSEDMKSNLFDLLILSEQTLNDMYEKCWQVLVKFCNEIIPCEGFLNLDKNMIDKIINHKDLKFPDQLKLFEAIRDWGLRYINQKNMKICQLGEVVEDLIAAVDFEKIEDNDFINTVLTSECLGKAEVIAFFMTHGLEIPRKLDFNNNKQLPFWLWFCATSDPEGKDKMALRRQSSSLSTVSEASPTISLKNGTVLAFHKVCRFRKGYQCPQKEIYQPHELRFRVDKNIKLLGVGFGFLFSCTDMGVTVHCQGPWETRQWTDITQNYCRVSGEKQDTADVRLMFTEPVRIEANQSYKVMVKIGRMSAGSSDVELWGGTGGQYTVGTDDANFFFMKAAVDPDKKVEEGDGDTNPGIITELLYQMDTGEYGKDEVKTEGVSRRRRQEPEEEESEQVPGEANTLRKRHRPADVTLQIPDMSRARRRENNSESTLYSPKRSPIEEYKPMSFSTNRWRTKPRDEDTDSNKTTPAEEYKPSSFSTNRWRTRTRDEDSNKTSAVEEYKPSSFSTNRWRPKNQEETPSKTPEEYTPSSFSTNRWRTRPREEETSTKTTYDSSPFGSRKTSAEEKPESYSTSRWRTRSREEAQPVKVELRKTIGVNDDKSSLPFLRRRESTENKPAELPFMRRRETTETKTPEMPAYLRRRTNPVEDNKTATPFGRSRFGATTTAAGNDDRSRDTTTRSRFLRDSSDTSSSSALSRPSDSYSLRTRDHSATRYGNPDSTSLSRSIDTSLSRTREPSLSRARESSLTRARDSSSVSRFGPSSTASLGSTYYNRYDSSAAGGTDRGSDSNSSKYGTSSAGRTQRRYTGADSDSTLYRSKYGSSLSNGSTNPDISSRYRSSTSKGISDLGSGSRYGSSLSTGGVKDTGPRSRYGTYVSTGAKDLGSSSRYNSSSSTGMKDLSSSNKYGSLAPTNQSDYGSGRRYSSSTANDVGSSSRLSRYSSPVTNRGTDSTSNSISGRHGSPSTVGPSSTKYDSRLGTDSSTSKYGNDSSIYGSTSSKYGSSSSRY